MSIGYKSSKLASLPRAWVPEYFTVEYETLEAEDFSKIATEISDKCVALSFTQIIIRSSAVGENLNQRGRFDSFEVESCEDVVAIQQYISEIFSKARACQANMAVVVQKLLKVQKKGHLSNERRVSATRNHWEIEIEHPRHNSFRTNSQRDKAAIAHEPLVISDERYLQRLFGAVGSWINATFDSRAHIEWVIENNRLWIVQLDLEDDAPDEGINPWSLDSFRPHDNSFLAGNIHPLIHWSNFDDTEFRKVGSIRNFAELTVGNYPNIFVLFAQDAQNLLNEYLLAQQLTNVIGQKLVCRVDVRPTARDKMQGLNLPRTDTSSPDMVEDFIKKMLCDWRERQIDFRDAIFIIHEYLPAIAGAWADASPDQRTVHIDALWGLPDGLQYLDHDSFEFDLKVEQIVSEYIRYKGWYVAEEEDGTWKRRKVKRDLTRHSALAREIIPYIAQVTYELARKANSPLRIMWFVDVSKSGVSKIFPWFSHVPEQTSADVFVQPVQDQSVLRTLPCIPIRTPEDLHTIPNGRLRLRLDPDAQYMRDNILLNQIAEVAKANGHSVEIRGSGLCHAYYLLSSLGVAVITPFTRRYTRVRGKQTYGKLVRDKIPERIQQKGERVAYFELSQSDRRRALSSKLIEEAQEVATSTNTQDIASELADVLEVTKSIAVVENILWSDVEARAVIKREKVGSFDQAKVLVETDIPSRKSRPPSRRALSRSPYLVKELDNGVVIPFMSLMEDSVEFNYANRVYIMKLRPEGVFIEEIEDKDSNIQLELPFDGQRK